MVKNAGVAQMAEQGFCKPQVVGSIPTASTTATKILVILGPILSV